MLDLYHSTKSIFEYEHYLDLVPSNLRLFVTRLRISAHTLRIHTGRYSRNRIPRNERYCQCCNSGQIEDEYHFIIVCPYYQNLRIVYVKQYYRNNPSMFKFIQLLKSENKHTLCKLAIFYKRAIEERNFYLNAITHA